MHLAARPLSPLRLFCITRLTLWVQALPLESFELELGQPMSLAESFPVSIRNLSRSVCPTCIDKHRDRFGAAGRGKHGHCECDPLCFLLRFESETDAQPTLGIRLDRQHRSGDFMLFERAPDSRQEIFCAGH